MKKTANNNTNLYLGIALLAGVGAFAMNKNKQAATGTTIEPATPAPTTTPTTVIPKPVAPNLNLVLKLGSRGLEVGKLQLLMGLSADGIFGPITEAKLFALKGVKSVTLNQYPTLTAPKVLYTKGTRLMADKLSGTSIYKSSQNVDGTFLLTSTIDYTIKYGQAVGVVRGTSTNGVWYIVEYTGFLNNKYIGFVKINEVKSY
jgi:hypothetical protein